MQNKLLSLIKSSQSILITSHTSPDPDAIASLLIMGTTLRLNYPDKKIWMVLEEEPSNLDFLEGYDQIKFMQLPAALQEFRPSLFIIVDANSYARVSRQDGPKISEYIQENSVKTAIIDHHEPDGKDDTDVYINSRNIAAVQEVYELVFDYWGLQKPSGYAPTTMLGLYADSGGFAYSSPRHKETLELASKLVAAGVNIEEIKNRIGQYSDDQMMVISELTGNVSHSGDYTYTYLSDKFVDDWVRQGHPMVELNGATKPFVDNYIRNVGNRQWGFLVYRNPLEGEGMYSVSLRSVGGFKDVAAIAKKLNGGGHKAAAGAKVEAKNLDEALKKVQAAING